MKLANKIPTAWQITESFDFETALLQRIVKIGVWFGIKFLSVDGQLTRAFSRQNLFSREIRRQLYFLPATTPTEQAAYVTVCCLSNNHIMHFRHPFFHAPG